MITYTRHGFFFALFTLWVINSGPVWAGEKSRGQRSIPRHHISLKNLHTQNELNQLIVIRQDPVKTSRQWIDKRAHRQISGLLGDWRTGRSKRVPERLIWYLYLIGQHFDAPIDIVSGYRHDERKTSRHKKGSAVDFRVRGVDAKKVWSWCKRFRRIGLGYYPKSKFVHLDTREKAYYWIDDSGPGEEAKYRSGVTQSSVERKRDRQRQKEDARRGH